MHMMWCSEIVWDIRRLYVCFSIRAPSIQSELERPRNDGPRKKRVELMTL